MAAKIREATGIDSALIPSDRGAFEIHYNGELLHSKLQTHEWPDFDAIAGEIKARVVRA
ncbi:MAG: Rdx family protein [Verrucomicrobiota bacterium]|nr:Rdx family protein [Verrucomicrobiota bacterium]